MVHSLVHPVKQILVCPLKTRLFTKVTQRTSPTAPKSTFKINCNGTLGHQWQVFDLLRRLFTFMQVIINFIFCRLFQCFPCACVLFTDSATRPGVLSRRDTHFSNRSLYANSTPFVIFSNRSKKCIHICNGLIWEDIKDITHNFLLISKVCKNLNHSSGSKFVSQSFTSQIQQISQESITKTLEEDQGLFNQSLATVFVKQFHPERDC